MTHLLKITTLSFMLFFVTGTFAQETSGEQSEIKELIMSSNEITTILYNYGSVCKPNTLGNIADMAWKELGYMFEFGPLLAAEVIGENGDTLHITNDSFILPFQGDYNYDGTQKWGWLPREGYANPNNNEIANSLNTESWPSDWSDWPGEYGDDVIVAENEVYYVIDDFTNAEFSYFPFPDDTTKKGLGMSAEVRIYQFGGFLKDALIIKYKITNESPKDLSKVYFGFHGDPHIGGIGDYGDDRVGFLPNDYEIESAANTIYNFDDDGIGDKKKIPGYLSFKFVKTPNDLGLTSLSVAQYTNTLPNVPKNDPLMWHWLSADSIDTKQSLLNKSGDNINNFGTGPFQLNSGESTEIELAIFLSEDYEDMLKDAFAIQHYINWPVLNNEYDASAGDENYKIQLNEIPSENEGNVVISWNYSGSDPNALIFIDCSPNSGKDWIPITRDHNVNDDFIWDTKTVDDGVNYSLRVLAYNPDDVREFYYDNCNERFTIDNPEKNSIPEFSFITFPDTLRREWATVKWISEDADNSELLITVEHSTNSEDSFNKIYEGTHSSGENSFSWNLSEIPNYETNYLRFSCLDDSNETVSITEPFIINIKKGFYTSSPVVHTSGSATAVVELIITDTLSITNDIYELTFNTENKIKFYSVRNINTDQLLIENINLIEGMSSPTFEGLRLTIHDTDMDIDYSNTHFNRIELEPTYNVFFSESNADYLGYPHVKSSLDWIVVFNDLDTNSDGSWVNIGDSTLFIPSMKDGVCPFEIIDLDNEEKANYLIDEARYPNLANNQWDVEETIILRPRDATASLVSYALNFDFSSGIIPQEGDTLYIITYNPIDSNDVYQFKADDNYILSNKDNAIKPEEFRLYQNYPNPFNPSTTIKYSIPVADAYYASTTNVLLKVYDILGREVATLVNEQQQPGNYEVEWNAAELTSGVYLYKISVGSLLETKKMMLLK